MVPIALPKNQKTGWFVWGEIQAFTTLSTKTGIILIQVTTIRACIGLCHGLSRFSIRNPLNQQARKEANIYLLRFL